MTLVLVLEVTSLQPAVWTEQIRRTRAECQHQIFAADR